MSTFSSIPNTAFAKCDETTRAWRARTPTEPTALSCRRSTPATRWPADWRFRATASSSAQTVLPTGPPALDHPSPDTSCSSAASPPRKNVDRLLTAYALVRERRPDTPPLVLAGQATPESSQTLARLTNSPLAGHVRHEGYVDEQQLRRLYEEAAFLVLPSLDEGFGIPALEAMTIGVPVIAAARGALPEVVDDAGLLVDPLDVTALAGALERMLNDAQLRDRLAVAGAARAPRFTWRASADALIGAYAQAIERHRETAHAHRD